MDLDFKEVPKYTLSANEIRTYCSCPRKRYYSSRDCLALRANKPQGKLILGSAIHDALAYYYTNVSNILRDKYRSAGEVIDTGLVEMVYNYEINPYSIEENCSDQRLLEYELDEPDKKVFTNVLQCYKDTLIEDLTHYEVIECEMPFHMNNWPIKEVQYHGFIDMVVRDVDTGKIYFYEHKTCKTFRPDIYDRFDIQLHIYAAFGYQEYGDDFGGLILNQLKKAKTPRGYDFKRDYFEYSKTERNHFLTWLKKKTKALTSKSNIHEPCNNYMECKMCEYAPICLEYGYDIPKEPEAILNNKHIVDEEGDSLYQYDPREDPNEKENKDVD